MEMRSIFAQERKKRKLSQEDVAKILNISRAAYGMYEIGKNTPTIESILKLAELYSCSTDYLLGRYNES